MSRSQSQSRAQADFAARYEHLTPNAPSSKRIPRVFRDLERTLELSGYDWSNHNTTTSLPRSSKRSQPDEALISSLLLTTPPLSCHSTGEIYTYTTSPIAKALSSTSHLSVECTASSASSSSETDYTTFSRFPAVRQVPQQSIEISLPLRRKHRSDSDATCVDDDSSFLRPTQRTRSATCSSDETVVNEDYHFYQNKSGSQKPVRRTSFLSEQAPGQRTMEEVERFRRRISRRNRKNTALESHYPDEEPFYLEEEELEPTRKEHPVSAMFSVLRHQYVAVGLTIQLALHRAERKVVKKLKEGRGRRNL